MEVYLKPIISACYVFPILAVIFTIPYILYEYHKYGSILILRTGIVYTFIFYMLTSYFMTVLPLPPRSSVTPDTASVLLVPFDAIRRIIATANVTLSQPSTYVSYFECFCCGSCTRPYRYCLLAYILDIILKDPGGRCLYFHLGTACSLNWHRFQDCMEYTDIHIGILRLMTLYVIH